MKFDSIKSRLVLMTLICVIGMGGLVASQHYFTQQLITLNQQRDVLLRMRQDLLQMRRHEKDFLLRSDEAYFIKFSQQAVSFNTRLDSLVPMFSQYDLPITDVESLSNSIETYREKFQEVVALQRQIGLTLNSGIRSEITNLENRLSETEVNRAPTRELFGDLQLATRNFQITQEAVYAREIEELSTRLVSMFDDDQNLNVTLQRYQSALAALVNNYLRFGLTHNDGLRGEFRQSAHNVENQLKSVDSALQPLIEQQEAQVRIYGLGIAALTSVVLILVLIKSFATFHRAFVNFLTFFYRCKRQYQKIDTRKLGFAELKSLAELANEMVESKRNIEARLASVEAELANKKAS